MKPHKHAEIIRAWADGARIESTYQLGVMPWTDDPKPLWLDDYLYRIKPAEPEKVYPRTRMTREELSDAWNRGPDESFIRTVESVANAALRHACDNGQVVTRKEFDLAVVDRKARDLAVAQAVDEAWRTKVFLLSPRIDHMTISRFVNLPLILDGVKP